MGSNVGKVVGGTAGFMTGGPVGAAVGAELGGSLLGGGPEMPATPDYTGAAQATAQGNIQMAREAAAANRVNQITPYGTLTYTQSGKDQYGNPTWTANQTLSPEQQQLYQQQTGLSQNLLGAANRGAGNLDISGVDQSQLPSTGINPGQNYTDAMMQQMQPQLQRDQAALNQQLANQGIGIGSEAYQTAQQQQSDAANRARLQAITGGMQTGLAANQQAFQQAAENKQLPVNLINALRGGSQVQGPNYVNAPQQATTEGPNMLAAAGMQNQAAMNQYNAQMGQQNAMMGGLFGLGSSALMAPKGTFTGMFG